MEATIRKDDQTHVTLILDGWLDTSVSQQTEREVEPLFGYENCEIVIDCSRLEYISSSGLRLLMMINQRCSAHRCNIFIKGMQEKVYDVFRTTGFVHLFRFK